MCFICRLLRYFLNKLFEKLIVWSLIAYKLLFAACLILRVKMLLVVVLLFFEKLIVWYCLELLINLACRMPNPSS